MSYVGIIGLSLISVMINYARVIHGTQRLVFDGMCLSAESLMKDMIRLSQILSSLVLSKYLNNR